MVNFNHYPPIKLRFIAYALPICALVLFSTVFLDLADDLVVAAGFHLTLAIVCLIMVFVTRRLKRPVLAINSFLLLSFFALAGQFFISPEDASLPIWMGVFPILFLFVAGVRIGLCWSLVLMTVFTARMYIYPKFVGDVGVSDVIYANTVIVFLFTIGMAYLYEKVSSQYQNMLNDQAKTDYLTGINNRRAISAALENEILRAKRYKKSASLLLIDIDHFKKINDQYGHDVGDKVLRIIADIICKSVRSTDMAARWGGEEFLVILPETDAHGAKILAERIRTRVASYQFSQIDNATLSIGVSTMILDDDPDTLVKRTDLALYRAKEAGRNRVEAEA